MKCPRCDLCFGRLSKALSVTLVTMVSRRFRPAENLISKSPRFCIRLTAAPPSCRSFPVGAPS
eukprot:5419370-Pyramimonas_sp.AAC.1